MTKQTNLTKQLRVIVSMLLIEFVFGVFITTIASFDGDGKPPLPHMIGLSLHILIALGLLFGTGRVYAICSRSGNQNLKKLALLGFLSIVSAVIGGVITIVGPYHEAGTFVMALSYMLAISIYGVWFLRALEQKPSK